MYIDAFSNILFADNLKQDLEIRNLVDTYQLGFRSFFNGGRKPIYLNPQQHKTLLKRVEAIRNNNVEYAAKLTSILLQQGVSCFDQYTSTGYLTRTRAEQIIQASNPYIFGTMLYKEWQRGYDKAFLVSQNYQNQRNSNNEDNT